MRSLAHANDVESAFASHMMAVIEFSRTQCADNDSGDLL
jgi:hypothetical protein